MKKYDVVVKATGFPVATDCETREEAVRCMVELYKLDKMDGVFEKGFYCIVEA